MRVQAHPAKARIDAPTATTTTTDISLLFIFLSKPTLLSADVDPPGSKVRWKVLLAPLYSLRAMAKAMAARSSFIREGESVVTRDPILPLATV